MIFLSFLFMVSKVETLRPSAVRRGSNMNIGHFARFCEKSFSTGTQIRSLQDSRRQPHIPTSIIFRLVFDMVILGLKSLLQVDQLARTVETRRWYGSDRAMVASDTAIERCLRGIHMPVMSQD